MSKNKNPTPKADGLRKMREDRFTSAKWPSPTIAGLREAVAAIPAKKPPKKPKDKSQ